MRSVMQGLLVVSVVILGGCYFMRGSDGGGETGWEPPRKVNPADIALPEGYRIEVVAEGLTFPTGITFDDEGRAYVVEAGYAYGEVFTTPRLLRIDPGGKTSIIAEGENNGPWTAVFFHQGAFIVTEGGQLKGGRILRVTQDGKTTQLVEGLPSLGDHHTNGAIVGPDGFIYFGQGTATNSGVVGTDNAAFGWLKRHPTFHDIPCNDIVLTGMNFDTENPLDSLGKSTASTGAFVAFNRKTAPNQKIEGKVPCNGSVMRLPVGGGPLELFAWGFRNPFGLAFSPDGKLYVTDNGYDDRGSRPVWGAGDVLWAVEKGKWYGWPDYSAAEPLTEDVFKAPGEPVPEFLIAGASAAPPPPAAVFGVHSSSDGIDFSKSSAFGYEGEAFVAQFGDQAPVTGKILAPVGFKVVRVDVRRGVIVDFATNRGYDNGPASHRRHGGFERPVAVRFDPSGKALYVVDFGVMLEKAKSSHPQVNTGVVWKIAKEG